MIIWTGIKLICMAVGSYVVTGKILDNFIIPTIQGIKDGVRQGKAEARAERKRKET